MVYDPVKYVNLDENVKSSLSSQTVRKFLQANCVPGADGKTPEYRVYKSTQDVAKESKVWQDAMARPRPNFAGHWIVVSNGTTGYEGPMPATVSETLQLLQKYVGGKQ